MAWSIFQGIINNNSMPDITRLFDERSPPPNEIPKLNIFQEEKAGVLLNKFEDRSIKIARIRELLKDNSDMYLTGTDKLSQKRKFSMWFKNLEGAQIAMAILSMLGGLSSIILIFVLYKHCNLAGLVASMAIHTPKAKSMQIRPKKDITWS